MTDRRIWSPLLTIYLVVLVSCGDNGPTGPTYPQVAGTYTGPIEWLVDGSLFLVFDGRIIVQQSGARCTITGSWTWDDTIIRIAAFTGNINLTGYFAATSGGTVEAIGDPDCGRVTGTGASLNFSGDAAHYVETATSQFCGDWVLQGTLTRR